MRRMLHVCAAAVVGHVVLATGQSAAAATVTPFAQYLQKECDGSGDCFVAYPNVAAGSRLEIEHVSCEDTVTGSLPTLPKVARFNLYVLLADQFKGDYAMLPSANGIAGSTATWTVDGPTFALVLPGQNAQARITLDKAPATQLLQCTISGHAFAS